MYYFLSASVGFIISIMVALNGKLTESFGVYHATVLAHVFALIILLVIVIVRREKIKIDNKLPLYYFMGGFLGVLTTVFNNYAFSYLDVSVLLSLCLFGQSVTSLILDLLHVFNHQTKNNFKTYIGLAFLSLGITIMIVF